MQYLSVEEAASVIDRLENMPIDEYDCLAVDTLKYINFLKEKIKWLTASRKRAKDEKKKLEEKVKMLGETIKSFGIELDEVIPDDSATIVLTKCDEDDIMNY